jgi:hypothetical protein
VTGSVAAVRLYRIDRPRLNLRLETSYPDMDARDASDTGPPYVRLGVTNEGRRPVTVANVGYMMRPAQRFWPSRTGWVSDRYEYPP